MSTHVVGFREPDEEWTRMKSVYDACEQAGIEVPRKVVDFFNGRPPDAAGIRVDLSGTPWKNDHSEGYEIDLVYLRQHYPQLKKLRFYNSW